MNLLQIACPKNRWQVALIFSGVLLAFIIGTIGWTASQTVTFNDPPEEIRDGVFYDNMAQCFLKGEWSSFDFEDQAWREKYQKVNEEPRFQGKLAWVLDVTTRGPTTSRPPGFPVFLAVIYRIFGWRWDAVRVVDCILVSLSLAMLITWAWRRWGAIPAIVSTGTLLLDFSVMTYAGYILTEPIATSLMCVLFVIVVNAVEKPTVAKWVIAGVVFALLIYVRANWTLWLVLLAASAPLLTFARIRQFVLPVKPHHLIVFLATVFLLVAPSWLRNCQVTGHFQPLGTGGSMGLVGAYCDESLADHGNWQHLVFYEHMKTVVSQTTDHSKWTTAQWEYEIGRQGSARARAWAISNWHRLPRLAIERLITHWGLNEPLPIHVYAANVWLLVVGGVGIFLAHGRVRGVLLVILIMDTLVAMATWAHHGRYAIPIRPLVHVVYGLAVVLLIQWLIHLGSARK